MAKNSQELLPVPVLGKANACRKLFHKLYEEMDSIDVPKVRINPKKMMRGEVLSYKPVFHYIFWEYNSIITKYILVRGGSLPRKDEKEITTYLESVWRVLTLFDYTPELSVHQFNSGQDPSQMIHILISVIGKVRIHSTKMWTHPEAVISVKSSRDYKIFDTIITTAVRKCEGINPSSQFLIPCNLGNNEDMSFRDNNFRLKTPRVDHRTADCMSMSHENIMDLQNMSKGHILIENNKEVSYSTNSFTQKPPHVDHVVDCISVSNENIMDRKSMNSMVIPCTLEDNEEMSSNTKKICQIRTAQSVSLSNESVADLKNTNNGQLLIPGTVEDNEGISSSTDTNMFSQEIHRVDLLKMSSNQLMIHCTVENNEEISSSTRTNIFSQEIPRIDCTPHYLSVTNERIMHLQNMNSDQLMHTLEDNEEIHVPSRTNNFCQKTPYIDETSQSISMSKELIIDLQSMNNNTLLIPCTLEDNEEIPCSTGRNNFSQTDVHVNRAANSISVTNERVMDLQNMSNSHLLIPCTLEENEEIPYSKNSFSQKTHVDGAADSTCISVSNKNIMALQSTWNGQLEIPCTFEENEEISFSNNVSQKTSYIDPAIQSNSMRNKLNMDLENTSNNHILIPCTLERNEEISSSTNKFSQKNRHDDRTADSISLNNERVMNLQNMSNSQLMIPCTLEDNEEIPSSTESFSQKTPHVDRAADSISVYNERCINLRNISNSQLMIPCTLEDKEEISSGKNNFCRNTTYVDRITDSISVRIDSIVNNSQLMNPCTLEENEEISPSNGTNNFSQKIPRLDRTPHSLSVTSERVDLGNTSKSQLRVPCIHEKNEEIPCIHKENKRSSSANSFSQSAHHVDHSADCTSKSNESIMDLRRRSNNQLLIPCTLEDKLESSSSTSTNHFYQKTANGDRTAHSISRGNGRIMDLQSISNNQLMIPCTIEDNEEITSSNGRNSFIQKIPRVYCTPLLVTCNERFVALPNAEVAGKNGSPVEDNEETTYNMNNFSQKPPQFDERYVGNHKYLSKNTHSHPNVCCQMTFKLSGENHVEVLNDNHSSTEITERRTNETETMLHEQTVFNEPIVTSVVDHSFTDTCIHVQVGLKEYSEIEAIAGVSRCTRREAMGIHKAPEILSSKTNLRNKSPNSDHSYSEILVSKEKMDLTSADKRNINKSQLKSLCTLMNKDILCSVKNIEETSPSAREFQMKTPHVDRSVHASSARNSINLDPQNITAATGLNSHPIAVPHLSEDIEEIIPPSGKKILRKALRTSKASDKSSSMDNGFRGTSLKGKRRLRCQNARQVNGESENRHPQFSSTFVGTGVSQSSKKVVQFTTGTNEEFQEVPPSGKKKLRKKLPHNAGRTLSRDHQTSDVPVRGPQVPRLIEDMKGNATNNDKVSKIEANHRDPRILGKTILGNPNSCKKEHCLGDVTIFNDGFIGTPPLTNLQKTTLGYNESNPNKRNRDFISPTPAKGRNGFITIRPTPVMKKTRLDEAFSVNPNVQIRPTPVRRKACGAIQRNYLKLFMPSPLSPRG